MKYIELVDSMIALKEESNNYHREYLKELINGNYSKAHDWKDKIEQAEVKIIALHNEYNQNIR